MAKKEFKEKVKETTKKFEKSVVSTYSDPERMKDWLKTQLRFKKYSPTNRMLIYSQNKDAVYVQSYNAWQKLGYAPKGSGTGIKILSPRMVKMLELNDGEQIPASKATEVQKQSSIREFMKHVGYGICYVFDISSTEAEEKDLLKKARKTWGIDTNHIYEVLSEYTGIESLEKENKLTDFVHKYVSERLTEEYGDFEELPMLIEADEYCVLHHFGADAEMLDFKSFNKTFSEEDVALVKKLNDAICKSSVFIIEELAQAFA